MSITKVAMPEGAAETLDDGIGFVALVDRMQQDPALKVVNSARISYDKQKSEHEDKDRKLASFLWEHGHTSPFRHSFYTFHWKAPLFVFRQAFKYQVGSGWRTYEVEGETVALNGMNLLHITLAQQSGLWFIVFQPVAAIIFFIAILAEKAGVIRFEDIVVGSTVRPEAETTAGKGKKKKADGGEKRESLVVIEHKGEKHPQMVIEDADGKILDFHYLPAKARIEITDGHQIKAGYMLARQPRGDAGSQDITGGLPRVTEIFEARKPKDPAIMAEISGTVEILSDKRKGKMTIRVVAEGGLEKDHHVPQDKHLLVHSGDRVAAGDPLIDGPLVPHDILRIKGEEALYNYMLDEVQNVYRAQGVTINDKHIEVILSQMLRKVRVENTGDTDMLPHEVVDKMIFRENNTKISEMGIVTDAGETSLAVGTKISKAELKEANAKAEADGIYFLTHYADS